MSERKKGIDPQKDLITITEAAREYADEGVTKRRIYTAIRSEKLTPVQVGSARFLRRSDVEEWNASTRPYFVTDEEAEQMRTMFSQGLSRAKIAEKLKRDREAVARVVGAGQQVGT